MDKRLIEETFPVREVSEESLREKNIRHDHISTLHLWWARRPLTSSRATNYAALIPIPKNPEELEKQRQFIIKLSKWENSLSNSILTKARTDILNANDNLPPKILDPFSGGGSIPLEALRLGCETYANDYNPVAVLIEKCTLEYPQKYNKKETGQWNEDEKNLNNDINKWGKRLLNEVKKEIEIFYSYDNIIGFIWAKTLPCQNPNCRTEIPLMKQYWLANKKNKKVALMPIIKNNNIEFEIVGQDNEIPKNFDPSKGTINKAIITCPICGSMIDANTTRKLFHEKISGERMVSTIMFKNYNKQGKIYRKVTKKDFDKFNDAFDLLIEKKKSFVNKWGNEPFNEKIDSNSAKQRTLWNYGMYHWADIFNPRQMLSLIIFSEKIETLYLVLLDEGIEEEYAKAIVTYLSFSLDRLMSFSTRLCRWKSGSEQNIPIFSGRNAFPMVFDYFEVNPIGEVSTNWNSCIKTTIEPLENLKNLSSEIKITKSSATDLPYSDSYFDAIFTDPPYYDNINYAELSDFYYILLKKTIGELYPELFTTTLVPKTKEIVANPSRQGNKEKSKIFFEHMLKKSFKEIYRVLKPNGIATIVYAHKTTEGWETVVNALLDSGLTVTASWPISTEMAIRLNAKETASLASSIYIICRKIEKEDIGWYNEIKDEIKIYVSKKLDTLWNEGISGADFFISAIGSAIEIFGKYDKVVDFEGNEIRAITLLSFVRDVVTDYAVRHILHNGIAEELSPLTKFYLLWRWNYQENTVPFDEARKLAQGAGIDLANEWNKGFIKKSGNSINVEGPEKREENDLKNSRELIDILHYTLILWNDSKKEEISELLQSSGWINREAFYKVAQAISETLPSKSKEKGLLDGFLSSKKLIDESERNSTQSKLFER